MAITLNTLSYNQDAFVTPNKLKYVGPDSTFSVKDEITLGRTAPKPTPTFAGVARSEVKRVKTVTLANGSTADAIVTLLTSLPVGMAQADAEALIDDVGDFAITADMSNLAWKHDLIV